MTKTFADVVAFLVGILNQLVGVLAAAALVLFMWSAFRYVYSTAGGKGATDRRTTMLWSLIALFVLFSIWGLVRVMCNTFLGESTCGGSSWNLNTGIYQESGPYPQGSVLPF